MPIIRLTDLAAARLDVISFFLVVYLLLAWGVKTLWNHLAGGFEKMPALNYGRALSLLLVAGLLMYVILTMISGARELMTPGAWERKGFVYELVDSGVLSREERRAGIERLKFELFHHAEDHEGQFPDRQFGGELSVDLWRLPGEAGVYNYIPGLEIQAEGKLLAYEPAHVEDKLGRMVILTDGRVESWSTERIVEAMRSDG